MHVNFLMCTLLRTFLSPQQIALTSLKGTCKILNLFFGFLHECGSVQSGWGCSIGQGLILGRSVPKFHNLAK